MNVKFYISRSLFIFIHVKVPRLAPIVARVPEIGVLRYPTCNLFSPIPILVMPLPIANEVHNQQGFVE